MKSKRKEKYDGKSRVTTENSFRIRIRNSKFYWAQ